MSATAQARILITELIKAGVTDLVVSPGSRNGPISLAALATNQIQITVRIDERSAAFTALGIAKVTKKKVAVAVTSGTAGAHLLPALIEAAQSDISLVAITADRPIELINTGANQTIEQLELFSAATKNVVDLLSNWTAEMWQNELRIALKVKGVIHINPRFSEPLVPTDNWKPQDVITAIDDTDAKKSNITRFVTGKRGVVITEGAEIDHAGEIASSLNWPLISEPAGTSIASLVTYGALVSAKFKDNIEIVVTVGRVGLSRRINSLINSKPRISVKTPTKLTNIDALYVSAGEVDTKDLHAIGHEWLNRWTDESDAFVRIINQVIDDAPLSGLSVASSLFSNLKSSNHLHAAASLSLRDLDFLMQPNSIGLITSNRGVNGIDGITATATGAALAWQRKGNGQSYCLLGDVALLHDLSSLTIPSTEKFPDLRLVIVDNNGGGVFHTIEQRGVSGFERVFGTPHKADLKSLLMGLDIPVTEVTNKSELSKIYQSHSGLSAILISGVDREIEADLRKQITNLVS
ncbi:MAG: 2-succinyl-5-enolpyruvyl-6-hydroxy-3-cyclohexene-1-carboxylic-acid synthase [Actinobacteria bacterium]|nr:2-succinyl-5-enolpyruvyl-6-hydroxy-3-cyclohexene-1-carboxylic-acid synthase [Actinomycetota bacterium]